MENAVEIKELTKKYKDFMLDVSAVIPKGFASALIGANGAGKTTLIDTLCGVTAKIGGEAVYFGNMTDTDDDALRSRIGYCSAANYFPLDWKLKTIAECMAIGYDNFDRARFTELCVRWSLGSPDDKKQKNMMKMSDGNRVRAALAAVFARDTDLLVLDEPASSLDPLARDQLCEMFREYLAAKDGERTILFSTHNIADMEFATDYAIFMAHGKVVEQGFVEDLKEKYILVHGEAQDGKKARPLMLSYTVNSTNFEGIALADNSANLQAVGAVTERPTLQQLSVGILRKAEEDAGK